jgi:hypothetical protein
MKGRRATLACHTPQRLMHTKILLPARGYGNGSVADSLVRLVRRLADAEAAEAGDEKEADRWAMISHRRQLRAEQNRV